MGVVLANANRQLNNMPAPFANVAKTTKKSPTGQERVDLLKKKGG
jgi:hypothetical protein